MLVVVLSLDGIARDINFTTCDDSRPPAAAPARWPFLVLFFISSLPVDSELAVCYAWEAREHSRKEKAGLKLREQRARLKLLGAGRQWEGGMRVRDRAGDPWEFRFVLLRGVSFSFLLNHALSWPEGFFIQEVLVFTSVRFLNLTRFASR